MADNNSSKKRAGIATLSDLKRSHESDSDSEGPQEYYTGGEKSGMMVQDPSKGNKDVDAIFDRAKQYGAREGAIDARQAPSSSRAAAFTGTGRTLSGQVTEPHSQAEDTAPEPVFHTITFWRNGFTVDDGTIRKLDDPANAPFLQSINNGECPRELEPSNRSIPVHVNLIKRDEEWKPPAEPKHKPFQGTGRTLGNTSDTQASASVVPIREAAQPFRGIIVDELKPFTSLQLRLADGTRMVARFNHHHTVADIRGFIDAARSGGPRSYGLQIMGFPPKVLSDPTQTIEEAGLANAVVIQKVNA